MDFLKDENGKLSSTRLAFLVWTLGSFLIWGIVSLKNWTMADVPWELISVVGMLMTGKVVQVYKEIKN